MYTKQVILNRNCLLSAVPVYHLYGGERVDSYAAQVTETLNHATSTDLNMVNACWNIEHAVPLNLQARDRQ